MNQREHELVFPQMISPQHLILTEREKKFIAASSHQITSLITDIKNKMLLNLQAKVELSIQERRNKYKTAIEAEVKRYKRMVGEDIDEDLIEIQRDRIKQLIEECNSLSFVNPSEQKREKALKLAQKANLRNDQNRLGSLTQRKEFIVFLGNGKYSQSLPLLRGQAPLNLKNSFIMAGGVDTNFDETHYARTVFQISSKKVQYLPWLLQKRAYFSLTFHPERLTIYAIGGRYQQLNELNEDYQQTAQELQAKKSQWKFLPSFKEDKSFLSKSSCFLRGTLYHFQTSIVTSHALISKLITTRIRQKWLKMKPEPLTTTMLHSPLMGCGVQCLKEIFLFGRNNSSLQKLSFDKQGNIDNKLSLYTGQEAKAIKILSTKSCMLTKRHFVVYEFKNRRWFFNSFKKIN